MPPSPLAVIAWGKVSSPRIVFHELILPPVSGMSVVFRHAPGEKREEKSCLSVCPP